MMPPSPVPFPNSRTLAGWWRQLSHARSSHQRPAFWVAHVMVHRVEALARVSREVTVDHFTALLLETLALDAAAVTERLRLVLPVDDAAIQRLVRALESQGLVGADSQDQRHLTSRGHDARTKGAYHTSELQRRVFHLIATEQVNRSPRFLPIRTPIIGYRADTQSAFDPRHLVESAAKNPDWKQAHGFPLDVNEVLNPSGDAEAPPWQRIMVHHMEIIPLALAIENRGARPARLIAFHANPDRAVLDTNTPIFELGGGWHTILPDLVREPTLAQWHHAWCEWASRQGIKPAEAEQCRIERREQRLRVSAGRALLERLRSARHEPLKHEACALAGDGRYRAAVPLEIVGS